MRRWKTTTPIKNNLLKTMRIMAQKAQSIPSRVAMLPPFTSLRVTPTDLAVPASSTRKTVVMKDKKRICGVVYFRASAQELKTIVHIF